MKKYRDLLKYSKYLKSGSATGTWQGGGVADGNIQVPFFRYETNIAEFMDFFMKSDYADCNYVENMDKNGWFDKQKLLNDIAEMTENEVLTCLTALMRQDRFCEGFFAGCIEEGTIEVLLRRLNELS